MTWKTVTQMRIFLLQQINDTTFGNTKVNCACKIKKRYFITEVTWKVLGYVFRTVHFLYSFFGLSESLSLWKENSSERCHDRNLKFDYLVEIDTRRSKSLSNLFLT